MKGSTCVEDTWIGARMGYPSFRLESSYSQGWEAGLVLPKQYPWFCYAKVPVKDVFSMRLLGRMGFYLVDTNVQFESNLSDRGQDLSYRKARSADPGDVEEVAEIAATSFAYSRFHLDPLIDNSIANQIKADWARNYFCGTRGDGMMVAEEAGKVVGFLQYLIRGNTMIIDLIAVLPEVQGQGWGRALIQGVEDIAVKQGCCLARVGTQVANCGSVRCYESLGYRFSEASYIYHCHGMNEDE